jgi:serine/threonine protein kinase
MSPEQLCEEDLDPRADILAVGVMLAEALTGRRPFDGEDHHIRRSSVSYGRRVWFRISATGMLRGGQFLSRRPPRHAGDYGSVLSGIWVDQRVDQNEDANERVERHVSITVLERMK